MLSRSTLVAITCCALALPVRADLAVVEELPWEATRADLLALVSRLEELRHPLPAGLLASVRDLLPRDEPADAAVRLSRAQKLLDERCLVGVHINPESRVKAARGPLAAELKLTRGVPFLVKVHNDGGVTHPLRVSGPQIRAFQGSAPVEGGAKEKDPARWLTAMVVESRPFEPRLTGRRLEYRILKLTAHQAGKREATLVFDVGQGTQDLGFRAEVPVLFRSGE